MPEIRLRVLGPTRVDADGTALLVTPRQAEMLLALAVSPHGLTLDGLQANVYGDHPVAPSTVKAEVSRLRRVVGSALASRPYRLTVPVQVDALEVLRLVRAGDALGAARAFTGPVLPQSDAPVARELSLQVETALRALVVNRADLTAATTLAERMPDDLEVLEHALSLATPGSSEHAMVSALHATFMQPDPA